MNNMITKASRDMGIPRSLAAVRLPTNGCNNGWRRCNQPGYQPVTNPSVRLEAPAPQRLPDALLGTAMGVC